MEITRQADYAVRAVMYLAQSGVGARASTAQIAHAQRIPPTFLAKIVSQLSAAGILRATRGARGGVMLGKPADEINVLEIVEAIDGPVKLNECVLDEHACSMGDGCAVRPIWCDAQAELVKRLRETSFAQLIRLTPPVVEVPQPA